MPLVTSGVEHGNLRELALARMKVRSSYVPNEIKKAKQESGSVNIKYGACIPARYCGSGFDPDSI
jgi:hypothetical protein